LVRAGEEYEHKGVKLLIREAAAQFDAAGHRQYMISYVLVDGTYTSPIAHLWARSDEDFRNKVEETIDYYLSIARSILLGGETKKA